jgi:hypothetical protein
MNAPLSTDQRCQKKVSDRTGFHWWPCGKPAKFLVIANGGRQMVVCGIHANVTRRHHLDAHVTALKETP